MKDQRNGRSAELLGSDAIKNSAIDLYHGFLEYGPGGEVSTFPATYPPPTTDLESNPYFVTPNGKFPATTRMCTSTEPSV